MGNEHEEAVRTFLLSGECERMDSIHVDRLLSQMAPEARYHLFAWEEPFVGHDAIRDELLREAPFYSDTQFEILNIASVGQTVFVERIDWVTMNEKRAGIHVVGVFEVDADGKIAIWRDYLDTREITTKVGADSVMPELRQT
jgi:limonene-1,2-epoxide hydrolase